MTLANEKKKRGKSRLKQTLYLVDFDKPAKCPDRAKFYRNLKKPKYKPKKSTKSVLLYDDPKTAQAVLGMASACGTANLYKVKKRKRVVRRG